MKNLRKLLVLIVSLALVMTILIGPVPARAFISNSQTCTTLKLLIGEGSGVTTEYLAKMSTRLQAAIISLRLSGKEAEALAFTGASNFTDAGKVSWQGGKKILAYLKAHPELGWSGFPDGSFKPNEPTDAQMTHKVLLEILGYKQDTDFTWNGVIGFSEAKGFKNALLAVPFTNSNMATALVEAMSATTKAGIDQKLVQFLVNSSVINIADAITVGLIQKIDVTFPLKNTVRFKLMTTYNITLPAPNNYTMEGLKKLKQLTNIVIDWETVPADAYNEALNIRLAAGVDLPDIVLITDATRTVQLAKDKMIIPFNDIITNYSPQFIKYLKDNPVDKGQYVYPDGNIYTISSTNNAVHMTYGYLLNQAFVKKNGLSMPVTIDDLYNLLVKMKQAGMKQPWAPIWGQEMQLASAWGVRIHPATAADFYAYDGKVEYEWINPRLKDFYVWANKCYKEGLMDKEFATQSYATLSTKVANGDVGFMDIQIGVGWAYNLLASKTEDTFTPIPPFKGPDGDRFIIKNYASSAPKGYVVTKQCKNPEIAVAFLTWSLLSQESFDLMYWGVEGKTYVIKDGIKVRPDGYVNDNLGKMYPQNALPYNAFYPQISAVWPDAGLGVISKGDVTVQPFFIDAYPQNLLTEDEMNVWAKKMTDIQTYVEENKQKFITGAKSLDEWDSYVKGVKDMGIDEVLKIEQARYGRYIKSVSK